MKDLERVDPERAADLAVHGRGAVPSGDGTPAAGGTGLVPPAGAAGAGARRGGFAQMVGRWREPWSRRRLWTFWAVSRAVLLTLVFAGRVLGAQQGVLGDIRLYAGWGESFVHGHGLPVGDETWQYPPGAVLVFAVPALARAVAGLSYRVGFPLFMVAVDAAVTAALARAGRGADGQGTAGRATGSSAEPVSPGIPRGPKEVRKCSSFASPEAAVPRSTTGRSAILRVCQGGPPGPGARVWLVGTLLLGPVTLARFDLVPAACVVAALLALRAGRPGRVGFAVMAGTLVKVWPAFLLGAVGRPSARVLARMAIGAACAAVAVGLVLVAAGAGGDLLGFLGAQRARGLQLEAVPATVFVVIRMSGAGETARYSYGSLQFGDSAARTVATVCTVVELVVVAAVVVRWWLLPARSPASGDADGTSAGWAVVACDRLLALLLVVLMTSRVLSPQYLLWVLAVAVTGVALAGGTGGVPPGSARPEICRQDRRDARERRWVGLIVLLAAVAVSQLVYPWRYNDVIQGRIVMSLVLVGRNVLLLVATWHAVRVSLAWPTSQAAAPSRRRRP